MASREHGSFLLPASPAAAGATLEDADAFLARLERSGRASSGALPIGDAAALDALAVACARGGGAFELAVGEGLEALARSGGDLRIGFSCVTDLARERLGLAPWQTRRLRRNAAALRARPLLRMAVLCGELGMRRAEAVLPVAVGADEAYWLERARVDTVRGLEAAVARPGPGDEDWHRLRLQLSRGQAEIVDGALAVAKVVMGPTATVWKQLWAMAAEFLSVHPGDPLEPVRPVGPVGAVERVGPAEPGGAPGPDVLRGASARSGALGDLSFHRVAASNVSAPDPYGVLADLTRLVAERAATDERLGRACLLVKRLGVARQLGWSCFDEWCVERLGLAPSTVYQRIALERRMVELPRLREALRSRRLSYEQARLVARVATPADVVARIEDAAGKTCIALVRDLEAEAHLQMCDAGVLSASVPAEAESLLGEAIRAARRHTGRPLTPGEALVEIARHFVRTWAPEVMRLVKGAHPVILRDGGLCQVPGCSLPAAHVHHLWYRSAGGPLAPWNELSMCLPHHLLCVHRGYVLVTGRAPDGLAFVLGEREVAAARVRA
jgi:hypothetical protein